MKNQIVILATVFLLVIFSVSACTPDDNKNKSSSDRDNGLSVVSNDLSETDGEEFNFDSEYKDIVTQLDELEKVLESLDQISEENFVIPEP